MKICGYILFMLIMLCHFSKGFSKNTHLNKINVYELFIKFNYNEDYNGRMKQKKVILTLLNSDNIFAETLDGFKNFSKRKNCLEFNNFVNSIVPNIENWTLFKENLLFTKAKIYFNEMVRGHKKMRIFDNVFKFDVINKNSFYSEPAKKYVNYLISIEKKKSLTTENFLYSTLEKINRAISFRKEIFSVQEQLKDYSLEVLYPELPISFLGDKYLEIKDIKYDIKQNWQVKTNIKFNKFNLGWKRLHRFSKQNGDKEKRVFIANYCKAINKFIYPIVESLNSYKRSELNNQENISEIFDYFIKTKPNYYFSQIYPVRYSNKKLTWLEYTQFHKGLLLAIQKKNSKNITFLLDLPFLPVCNNLDPDNRFENVSYYRIIKLMYDKKGDIIDFLIINYKRSKQIDKFIKKLCLHNNIGVYFRRTRLSDSTVSDSVLRVEFPISLSKSKKQLYLPMPLYVPRYLNDKISHLNDYSSLYNGIVDEEFKRLKKLRKHPTKGDEQSYLNNLYANYINEYIPGSKKILFQRRKEYYNAIKKLSNQEIQKMLIDIKKHKNRILKSRIINERVLEHLKKELEKELQQNARQ